MSWLRGLTVFGKAGLIAFIWIAGNLVYIAFEHWQCGPVCG